MKNVKKIIAALFALLTVCLCFSGCSSKDKASDEITADTLLIAYTEENRPFLYEENGEVKGFDAELFDRIFESIKEDYENYKFVKVDKDYKIGEDVYCVDENSRDCIAMIMAGGLRMNTSTVNEDYSLSQPIVSNAVLAVVSDAGDIASYNDLSGKSAAVVGSDSAAALDKNSAVKNSLSKITEYDASQAQQAVNDLKSGKTEVLIIDEFTLNTADTTGLKRLEGEIDNIEYVYGFKKWNEYKDIVNEAIYEISNPDYNGSDEFTPIVEKHFGYNASAFTYTPVEE